MERRRDMKRRRDIKRAMMKNRSNYSMNESVAKRDTENCLKRTNRPFRSFRTYLHLVS